jgi:hypothetical protein
MVNIYRAAGFLLSWMSILLLPGRSFKKFVPVTLFSALLLLTETVLAESLGWWKVKGGRKYLWIDALIFIFGPFFAANMWIFHLSNKKFLLYAFANLVMDLLFAFPLNSFFQKAGFYRLKKFNSLMLFTVAYGLSFINYGFQKIWERLAGHQAG